MTMMGNSKRYPGWVTESRRPVQGGTRGAPNSPLSSQLKSFQRE